MKDEQIRSAVAIYRRFLRTAGFTPIRSTSGRAGQCHVLWMLDSIDAFVATGRRAKAFRWLGFVQGALNVLGYYTIDKLKAHNMPAAS